MVETLCRLVLTFPLCFLTTVRAGVNSFPEDVSALTVLRRFAMGEFHDAESTLGRQNLLAHNVEFTRFNRRFSDRGRSIDRGHPSPTNH